MKIDYKIIEYVLNNSINGVIIVDEDLKIFYSNIRAKEIFEFDRNTKENYLSDFISKDELNRIQNHAINEFDKIIYKDKVLTVNVLIIENNTQFKGKAYIFQDISKYENIVDEIGKFKKLNSTLEAIINSSYDGIYVTDGHANTLMINKAYERITGIKSEQVLGKNMEYLVRIGLFNQSSSLLAIHARKQVTLRQLLKDGKEVLVTSTPVFSKNAITHVVTNVRDISELVNLKVQLMDTRALNQKYLSELGYVKSKLVNTPELIVRDSNMYKVIEMALKVASVDTTVLLNGETGVGKGQLSRFIHKNSLRSKQAFIEVTCSAIPPNLIESELFGYEKGAFTGANTSGKMGMFELANDGTILLDEISELPLDLQVKLLKVIEDKVIFRIGGRKPISVNIRIIAATNKDLSEMVDNGLFRKDLYYRLNVVPIYIYALRERKDDIIPLALSFLDYFNDKYKMKKRFQPGLINMFLDYKWPGNVRELRNLVERIIVISHEDELTESLLPEYMFKRNKLPENTQKIDPKNFSEIDYSKMTFSEATKLFEINIIKDAIEKYGSIKDACKHLKINKSTISRKLHK